MAGGLTSGRHPSARSVVTEIILSSFHSTALTTQSHRRSPLSRAHAVCKRFRRRSAAVRAADETVVTLLPPFGMQAHVLAADRDS